MNAQDLQNSILHLAIQGKLVEQREEEGTAKELLEKIEAEKKQLVKEKKIKKQKPLPAIKEDEIPFDIPESWEWVRIAEIGEIVGGGTPKTGNSEFWSGGDIPWLTPADMKFVEGKYVKNGERFITDKGLKGSSARLMPKGTIIYSSRAPIGYIAIADNDLATNQGFKSLVPYQISVNEYMYYCLISRTNEIISRASGTTFKEISGSEFGLTIVPLPPLEEQKRIVAKIEELMPYVDKYEIAYSEVEELNKKFPDDMLKSILQYAIQGKLVEQREEDGTAEDLYKQIQEEKKKLIEEGKIKKAKALSEITENEIPFDIPDNWKWVRLADVSENIHYGYTASANEVGNCKLLRITDIQNNSVDWDSVPYCNIKDKDYLTYGLKNRDIMIARTGGTIGKTYIVESLNDRAVFASYLIRVVPVNSINEKYLKKFMESPLYWHQLKAGSMGTGQPNVNGTTLSKLILPLPPLAEQERIVEEIENLLPYTKQLVK